DVCRAREPREHDAPLGGLQVEHDAALPAVHRVEARAVAAGRARHLPRRVAGGRLDLDDVGAQVSEEHGAVGTGHPLRDVEDADAVERGARSHTNRNSRPMHTIFQTDGPIATLTFNRPDARNAMTWEMYEALVEACESVDRDDRIRVFVVRGAGGKAFVAGTDISQFQNF